MTPKHYDGPFECIELVKDCKFCFGNMLKYLFRFPNKDNPLKDLDKAMDYLEMCSDEEMHVEPGTQLYAKLTKLMDVDFNEAKYVWRAIRNNNGKQSILQNIAQLKAKCKTSPWLTPNDAKHRHNVLTVLNDALPSIYAGIEYLRRVDNLDYVIVSDGFKYKFHIVSFSPSGFDDQWVLQKLDDTANVDNVQSA